MEQVVPDDLRSHSVRGGTAILFGQAARFFLTFGSQIILARLLDPGEFGIVAMVAPILGLVQLFTDFGLGHAVVQKASVSERELSTVFWLTVALSVVIAALFALSSPVIALMYGEPRVMWVALASSMLIVVAGTAQLQGYLISRNMQFMRMATIDVSSVALGVLAGIVSAIAGLGYWSLVVSQAVASLTTAILYWTVSGWRPSRPGSFRAISAMLRYGGDVTGLKFIQYIAVSIDKTMIGIWAGEVALGIYDRAWKLGWAPFSQLAVPVDRLAFPILSRLNTEPERYRNVFVQMLQMLVLIIMPGLLFAAFCADTLILLLFGSKWIATAPIFRWITLSAFITPVSMGAGWLFLTQARTSRYLRCTGVASLATIAAYFAGLPWGPEGVAAGATFAVYLVQIPMFVFVATRDGHVGLSLMLRALFPVMSGLAVSAVLLWTISHIKSLAGISLLTVSLVASYAGLVLTLGLLPSGRVMLRRVLALASTFRRR